MTGLILHDTEPGAEPGAEHWAEHGRDLPAGAPVGVAVFDEDRCLVLANATFNLVLDLEPAAAAGSPVDALLERLHARQIFRGLDGRTLLSDEGGDDEGGRPAAFRHRDKGGRAFELQSERLPGGGWSLTATAAATAVDAAENQAALMELLTTIVGHVPCGISVYGPDRRLRLCNAAFNVIMGGAPVAIGEHLDDIIERRARNGEYGPGDPAELAAAQYRYDQTKPQVRRMQRPNGTTIDSRTAPLPDGGHVSVVFDITGIVAAEAELARRAETLDTMLAHIRHGIVLWDRDRRIVAANPVAARLLHAPPGLLVPGRTLQEVTDSALERGNLGDGPTGQARAKWLLEQDRTVPHIDQRLTRGGRVLEVRSDPTSAGGFVTTYTDVTHVREAEEALLLSKTAAEAANAAKSRFLASMSTELRTPLTTILSETDALTRGAARVLDQSRVVASTATIAGSARTLLGLIDTVLDLTRLETGRFDLAEDRADVSQLVRSVLRRFDAAAAAAEVALIADLPEHLPALRVDERRVSQALAGIVSNAVKFTGAGGSVTISARRDWTQGGLLLQVRDTGPGIPDAELDRVFEPFVQLGHGAGHGTSAGLGLYVGRILMRAHGGELTLRSTVGQGTAATLHLPADRVLQDDALDPT